MRRLRGVRRVLSRGLPLLRRRELPELRGLRGLQLPGVQLRGLQLPGVQLRGLQLPGVQLRSLPLPGVQLRSLPLPGVQLRSLRRALLPRGLPLLVAICSHARGGPRPGTALFRAPP
jgi:hypothetical protein